MDDFFITQGDQLPTLDAVLVAPDKTVPDLTGLTVMFRMRPSPRCGGPSIDAEATILDAKGGAVRYSWGPNDTAIPGDYVAEFTTTVNGLPMTFPNNRYLTVRIKARLA